MNKNYIIAGLFLLTAVIVAVLLVYPKYQTLQDSQNKVAEKEKEYAAQLTLIKEISQITSRYKKLENDLAIIGDLLPQFTAKTIPELFTEFEKITSESGILLSGINFQSAPAKGSGGASAYNVINANISAIGTYDALRSFVKVIEQNKHLMDIASLGITPPSDTVSTGDSESKSAEQPNENKEISSAPKLDFFNFGMSINVYYR